MTTIDDFSARLDIEFGLMPIAIEEQRALLEREYHERLCPERKESCLLE